MKTLLLFFATIAYSQTLTPTLSEPFSYPGSTVILTIGFLNNSSSVPPITSLQWTISMPPGYTIGQITPGSATVAAGATVTCTNPGFACTSTAAQGKAFPNIGTIATMPVILSSTAAFGAQQIALTAASANAGAVILTVPSPPPLLQINAATGASTWFQATVGQGTCRASKLTQTPIRISWVCFNSYGANSGSYTADVNNGGNGTNWFYIGINSIGTPAATLPDENLSCLIQINATANMQTAVNGAQVPAYSGMYSCSGYSTSGSGTVAWP